MAGRFGPDVGFGDMANRPKPYKRKQYRRTFIRQWRKDRGLTLEQLAGQVGVTPSALSLLERGQSAYMQPMLEALAVALQTDTGSLLNRTPRTSRSLDDQLADVPEDQRAQIMAVVETMIKTGAKR